MPPAGEASAFADRIVILNGDEAALVADVLAMAAALLGVGLSRRQRAVLRVVPDLEDPTLSADLAALIQQQLGAVPPTRES